jgi:fructose-bisphosphate aldolase class II
LIGLVSGAIREHRETLRIALHLDHGRTVSACRRAIDIGFSSVMLDASDKPFAENIEMTRDVVTYAKQHNVSVEAELGSLMGIEDDAPAGNHYTDPADVAAFLEQTRIDSLAVAIGTMHGAHKAAGGTPKLRFDILDEIVKIAPGLPLVLHGASSIPQDLVAEINQFGGDMKNAVGIPLFELRRAVGTNVCKINVDSDGRVAFTAGVRGTLVNKPSEFDPRKYLGAGRDKMRELYISEIKNIMNSENKA